MRWEKSARIRNESAPEHALASNVASACSTNNSSRPMRTSISRSNPVAQTYAAGSRLKVLRGMRMTGFLLATKKVTES